MMENINKIIYRESDSVLVSEAQSGKVVIKYLDELGLDDRTKCDSLKTWCESKVANILKHVTYIKESNLLSVQDAENKLYDITVSELSVEDKAMVDAVGTICTQLINE